MNLEVVLNGMKLEAPFMNASGVYCCNNVALLEEWLEAGLPAVVTKTIGLESSRGNLDLVDRSKGITVFIPLIIAFLNAIGLPGQEALEWARQFEKREKALKELFTGKKVIGSVKGNTPEEFEMVIGIIEPYVDMLELNFSCPNIKGEIIGNNLSLMKELLKGTKKTKRPISVKIPYYKKESVCDRVLNMLKNNGIKTVTSINSLRVKPKYPLNTKGMALSLPTKYGGLSGPIIARYSLKQLKYIKKNHSELNVIFSGGVTPENALTALKHGADAIQLGSSIINYETPKKMGDSPMKTFYDAVLNHVKNFMKQHNINDIGKLKILYSN